MADNWDAIVIGSGIGGMTTAGFLAGVAGKKVLVLEKHSEPGGQTHVFRRDGASWDVGLHYVGEMAKGALPRSLMDFLTGGRLAWNKMPHNFERFVYPGLSFEVPSDPGEYKSRLIAKFPDEKKAICRYFRDIGRVHNWAVLELVQNMMAGYIGFVIGLGRKLGSQEATQTTEAYLQKRFRSPQLRALVATQWGDFGLPPSQSAFAIHSMIVGHYLHGAWFPEGGAGRIARCIERTIESRGGAMRVCQEVVAIIVEEGKAVGVRAIDRRGSEPREVEYRAPVIISDVGARITYKSLLPTEGEIGAKTAKVRSFVDSLEGNGSSAVTLYLRLNAPVSSLGIKGENFWVNSDIDHNSIEKHCINTFEGRPSHIYVSFPSAKSGEAKFHTAEIISFMDDAAFAAWKDKPRGNRGLEYSLLKKKIADGLLDLAETAIPGLKALVAYSELSTPLTVEHYTSHPRGRFYGLPAVPKRYQSTLVGPKTPIKGLYLSGCDAGCVGILGAMMGGVATVTKVLGLFAFYRIVAAAHGIFVSPITAERSPDKKKVVLERKRRLTPSIWELSFKLEEHSSFAPGQFARLRVADEEWRDYSIASTNDGEITLLVSTRTGGMGSCFAEKAEVGAQTEIEFPLGSYRLLSNQRRRVFIATGTGLAPFLPMFRELRDRGEAKNAELLFGCATKADNFLSSFASILPQSTLVCVSREPPEPGQFHGRVTAALGNLRFDPKTTDFYVCGSAAMVADCRDVLEKANAINIHTEAY